MFDEGTTRQCCPRQGEWGHACATGTLREMMSGCVPMPPRQYGSLACGVTTEVTAGREISDGVKRETAAVGAHSAILGNGQDLCLCRQNWSPKVGGGAVPRHNAAVICA